MPTKKQIIDQINDVQKDLTGSPVNVDLDLSLEPISVRLPTWISYALGSIALSKNPPKVLMDIDFILDERNGENIADSLIGDGGCDVWSVKDVIAMLEKTIAFLKKYQHGFIPEYDSDHIYMLKPVSKAALVRILGALQDKLEEHHRRSMETQRRKIIDEARSRFDQFLEKLMDDGGLEKVEEWVASFDPSSQKLPLNG